VVITDVLPALLSKLTLTAEEDGLLFLECSFVLLQQTTKHDAKTGGG
jgi:hypothetical protein